jgi:hypothetical protein
MLDRSLLPEFVGAKSFLEIQSRFVGFARKIMCSYELVYGDNERRWRVTALELYLSMNIWPDPYTHGAPEQRRSGTWYVHDDGRRAPIYSGVDITCGSDVHDVFGGVLIRELCKERRWIFQRIVRGDRINISRKGNVWTDQERDTVKCIHGKRVDASNGLLRLVESEERDECLYVGPRIGLRAKPNSPSENPEGVPFRSACLRVATWQTSILKTQMSVYPRNDAHS